MQEIITCKVLNPQSKIETCACGCHCGNDDKQNGDQDGARDAGTFSGGSHCSCCCSTTGLSVTGLESTMRGKK